MVTIVNLISNISTRCAGITLLGKSVELCLTDLKEKCSQQSWSQLVQALNGVPFSNQVLENFRF